MKNILTMLMLLIGLSGLAQNKKLSKTVFEASITCQHCKEKILKNIPYEKGVKNVEVDVDQKLVTVTYQKVKNSDDQLKDALEDLGYETNIMGQPVSFRVKGKCEMCKKRIESSAKAVSGVSTALWNQKSQMLDVVFDADQTNLAAIQKAIAADGHDAGEVNANIASYNELPDCCKYK